MSLEQELQSLRNSLADTHSNVDNEIPRLVADSGLRRADIEWSRTAKDLWGNILYKAVSEGKLQDLLKICIENTGTEKNISLYQKYIDRIVSLPDLLADDDSFIEVINKLRQNLNSTTIDDIRKDTRIKIYSLTNDVTDGDLTESLKQTRSLPFLGDEAYSLKDADIFIGYSMKNYILDLITVEKKNLVLMQERGIGKTSFINACLIPGLFRQNKRYLIIIVESYDNPLSQIKKYVKSFPAKFAQNFIYENSETDRPVIIIFDQFDCSIPETHRKAFFEDLKVLAENNFQIILACRNDDDEIESEIYKVSKNFEFEKEFLGLDVPKTSKALERLLEDKFDSRLCDPKVIDRIIKDCAKLESNNGKVQSQLLQIVCKSIFNTARKTGSYIDEKFYDEQNNSNKIIRAYLESKISKLETLDDKNIAWQLLAFFKTAADGQTLNEITIKLSKGLDLTGKKNNAEELIYEKIFVFSRNCKSWESSTKNGKSER